MPKITIEQPVFKSPKWPGDTIKPGEESTLTVEAPTIKGSQFVTFRIRKGKELVDIVTGKPGEQTAKWKAPNLPDRPKLVFDALLCEKPGPKNGFRAVLDQVTSPEAEVQGYKISITTVDAAFVPETEAIEVAYTLDDPAGVAKKGRIEIWGERYPTDKPLYTENFVPSSPSPWKTWKGKANAGLLDAKFISPEFSPYRVRMIIGPDQASVDDAFGAGLTKATSAEAPFEIRFQSIEIRIQKDPPAPVKTALGMDAGQSSMLVVEPRHPKGAFAVKDRLPKDREPKVAAGWAGGGVGAETPERDGMGRIRIACKRHTQIGESLNQGFSNAGDPVNQAGNVELHRVADGYMANNSAPLAGAGSTKYDVEKTLYKRPEIPVEVVGKLKSRDTAEGDAKKYGLFSKNAVGPAVYDLYAEDAYAEWMYANAAGAPAPLYAEAFTYFKNAAMKVKWGTHNAPNRNGVNPVISHWRQRFVIGADAQEEVGDTDEAFQKGKKELTVYLNRTPLTRDDDATADSAKEIKLDYAETSNKKIKLRKGLAFKDDVVWIVRTPEGPLGYTAVDRWDAFPPGDNCHKHFGGDRGREPEAALVYSLRKEYSGGLAGQFAYTALDTINLDPDKVDLAKRERVESQAVIADGDQKGLAGVIFSPSTMAGDKYVIEARLRERPYGRDLGWVADRPATWNVKGRSGTMVVWRLLTVSASWRMSLKPNTRGLDAGIGEDDPDAAGRPHPADGRMMNFLRLNEQSANGFSEWLALKADGSVAQPDEEAHQDVDLDNYRQFFNAKNLNGEAGFYYIPDTAHINNFFVRWDHYREVLPPGVPDTRQRLFTRVIELQLPAGTESEAAADRLRRLNTAWDTRFGAVADDSSIALTGREIPISQDSPTEYKGWVLGKVKDLSNEYMDTLIPQLPAPDRMRVLRWPNAYFANIYCDGNPNVPAVVANPARGVAGIFQPLGIAGYCRGSGQAFFFSENGNPDTFEHEMGHSLFLIHFAAGRVGNFGWKHHDHNYQHCLMGYSAGNYTVPLPAGKAGADIAIATNPRAWLCPKCLMKMRGWDEIKLPCNWSHPDVF